MMAILLRPIDSAILIYFRIVAGLLLGWELVNNLLIGKFDEYVTPSFHFSYYFFDWIKPWGYWGMVVHYTLTIFSAMAVAFNFHYRIFSVILFLGYCSLFLFEQSLYINHMYLYCLITFWMMFLPLDEQKNSQPAWVLYLIVFHMALAYFFGGIAKLNSDWMTGTPMNIFLEARKDYLLGSIYQKSWAPFAFSYGGIFFDLFIVPLLLIRQTRIVAFVASCLFHVSNVLMFGLATFPWFSLLLTTMFFDPSWPRKVPILRKFMPWTIELVPEFKSNKRVMIAMGIYVFAHLLIPLRHHLYPGNPSWSEEGHMFSWRMMLRAKEGSVNFFVQRSDQSMTVVNVKDFITEKQYLNLIGKPDLILQAAHFIGDTYQNIFGETVKVYASSRVGLNGRKPQEMIEPGVDLYREKRSLLPYKWIRPIVEEEASRSILGDAELTQ